ncbi:MAG: hypothetical protein HYU66_07370 [Armatimonadetes bacterium]|nr:hypothetical protein [Armatimonadota bacterium]
MMEAAALLQAKRGIPPEDQVPPEYREVERWAYQEHYPTAPPPEEILALGLPGAMGHVGHGLWQPIDLVSEALFSLPQGWSPDPASEMQAREAALGLLRDLGFTGDRPKQVLEALERWTRGFHDDPHVLGLVDRYLAAAPRFNGPIVRGFSLPVGRNGWPELGRYDPRAFAGERRTVRPAGKPPGLVLGRAFRVPRPKAFSAGRPFADNTYEVLAGSHAGKSIRGFSVFWAQDEVILPRGVRLMPVRIERIIRPLCCATAATASARRTSCEHCRIPPCHPIVSTGRWRSSLSRGCWCVEPRLREPSPPSPPPARPPWTPPRPPSPPAPSPSAP